jgi:hypothetical protein
MHNAEWSMLNAHLPSDSVRRHWAFGIRQWQRHATGRDTLTANLREDR